MAELHDRLERIPLSRPHYRLLAMGGLGLTFDGLDVAMLAFVLPSLTSQWHLSGFQVGLIGSSTLIGYLFGALGAGIVADRIGRRRVMMWALAVYSLSTLAAAAAPSWEVFFALRMIAGVGTGAESVIIPTLLAEFVPAAVRGRLIGALAGFFSFGYVLAALLGRFVVTASADGWRIVHVLTALPVVMLLWWRRSVPESPRFLLSKNRVAEATTVVEDLERRARRSLGRELAPVTARPAPEPEPESDPGIRGLWSRQLAPRTAIVWLLWLVITFSFYGFFTFMPSLLAGSGLTIVKSFDYALVIYFAQIPGYYSAAFLNDYIDRKWTIAAYLSGGVVAAYLLSQSDGPGQVMVFGACLSFFMNGLYASIYAYTPELYPTPLRARGMGAASGFGRLGGIAAPIVIGSSYHHIGFSGVFLMTAAALLLGALVVALFGVATKNRTLEEIAEDAGATPGDAPGAADDVAVRGGVR